MERLPPELAASVFTHASWTARRSDSYERLAFLGDSVLALAITAHLYPRLEADRFGAGRLTKIRAQAVSGRSCRAVADRLGLPERLRAAAPASAASSVPGLISTERVLASVIEAVIGACYLEFGYETTRRGGGRGVCPGDRGCAGASGRLQVGAAGAAGSPGALVSYEVVDEQGPPHDRTFSISATIDGTEIGARHGPQQEGRRAGGRPAGTRGTRMMAPPGRRVACI